MRSAALCLLAICWLFRSQMLFVVWDALFGVCVTALPLSLQLSILFYLRKHLFTRPPKHAPRTHPTVYASVRPHVPHSTSLQAFQVEDCTAGDGPTLSEVAAATAAPRVYVLAFASGCGVGSYATTIISSKSCYF